MRTMTIPLAAASDGENRRLYERIYRYIRDEIREGRLSQGERLPSTRMLAETLQVSRTTAASAYAQLLSEGYIEALPRRGYFISLSERLPRERLSAGKSSAERSSARTALGKDAAQAKIGAAEEENKKKSHVIDFSPDAVDMSRFPYATWRRITRNVLSEGRSDLFGHGEAQGDLGLRRAIAAYLYTSRGVDCLPEQIFLGAGMDVLLILLSKMIGYKKTIVMENPTYLRAYKVLKDCFAKVICQPADEKGMRFDGLEQVKADVIYTMPSHQYPMGQIMPIGRRMEALHWAEGGEGRYVIEDDYDSELRFQGKPIPSLHSSDRGGKVIYLGTFSKVIAPAIRIGYMVLPPALLQVCRKTCGFYASTVSRIDQAIVEEFMEGGYFERHLHRMRKRYREKHDLLLEELKPFKKSFRIRGESAGLHVLLEDTTGKKKEARLVEAALSKGVRVYGLSAFFAEPLAHPAAVLLGFGALSGEEIRSGVAALKKAWQEFM